MHVDCCISLAESGAVFDVVFLAVVMFPKHVSGSGKIPQQDRLLWVGRDLT